MESGYIAIKYGQELYGTTTNASLFRLFGIFEKEVRERLTIIVAPKSYKHDSQWGIFPDQGRTHLVFSGDGEKGANIPLNRWGLLFLESMPEAIRNAIKKAQTFEEAGDLLVNSKLIKRLLDKLSDRFNKVVSVFDPTKKSKTTAEMGTTGKDVPNSIEDTGALDPHNKGDHKEINHDGRTGPVDPNKVEPEKDDTNKIKPFEGSGVIPDGKDKLKRRIHTKKSLPDSTGTIPTVKQKFNQELPQPLFRGADAMTNRNHICQYNEYYPLEEGKIGPAVILNTEAPALVEAIKYYQGFHHESFHDEVKKLVRDSYAAIAVCKVAHVLQLSQEISKQILIDKYLSEEALTTGMLGLAAEDAFISPKLGMFGPKVTEDTKKTS
jgi:hypothetical protein